MKIVPLPNNEFIRLRDLHALNILDTQPDARFDYVAKFAALMLEAPICFIAFLDKKRQWFKATHGINSSGSDRNISICSHAIYSVTSHKPRERIFEIQDTTTDYRFFDNPFVIEEPFAQSYISYVLQSNLGNNIGTLCLLDTIPRQYGASKKQLLILLGSMIENILYGNHHLANLEQKFH